MHAQNEFVSHPRSSLPTDERRGSAQTRRHSCRERGGDDDETRAVTTVRADGSIAQRCEGATTSSTTLIAVRAHSSVTRRRSEKHHRARLTRARLPTLRQTDGAVGAHGGERYAGLKGRPSGGTVSQARQRVVCVSSAQAARSLSSPLSAASAFGHELQGERTTIPTSPSTPAHTRWVGHLRPGTPRAVRSFPWTPLYTYNTTRY